MAGTNITLPPGAFAAAKSGAPQPTQAPAPKADAKPVEAKPAAPTKEAPKTAQPKADSKPAAAEPPKDSTPAEKKVRKVKANGREVDVDLGDEAAVLALIEKGLGADETFRTSAQIRRQAEQFFAMLKDPAKAREVLSDPRVGLDVKKFAEEIVWEQIQQQQREEEWKKDPAKKKAWEDEQELKRLRDEKNRSEADAAARQKAADTERWAQEYNTKITKALELGGIPKTESSVARMADLLTHSIEQGLDLSAEDLVQQVRQDYIADLTSVLGNATGEQLLELLGEAGAKKLREADLKRLRSPEQTTFPKRSPAKQAAAGKTEQAPKRLAGSDWRAALTKDFLNRPK